MNRKYLLIIPALLILSFLVFSFTQNEKNRKQPEKAPELVSHWTFDEQQGDTIYDQSSHNAHGVIKGNPNRPDGIVGKGSLEFDGRGDFIEILENGETPSHLQDLGKGSISVWFKARNIPVGNSILPVLYYGNKNGCSNMFDASNEGLIIEVAHGSVFPRAQGVFFTIFSNGCQLPSFCYDSHSDMHLSDRQGAIKEGKWYNFIAVVGENYNTGYLNGKKLYYREYNFNSSKASLFFKDAIKHQRMWIGKGYWDHASKVYFDGFIDDLRIYDQPLSEKKAKEIYNMKKPG